jgi:hypothetical protein
MRKTASLRLLKSAVIGSATRSTAIARVLVEHELRGHDDEPSLGVPARTPGGDNPRESLWLPPCRPAPTSEIMARPDGVISPLTE